VSCISRIILNETDVEKQSEGLKGSTRIYANHVLIYRQIGRIYELSLDILCYLKSPLREEIENARHGRIEREHRNNRNNG